MKSGSTWDIFLIEMEKDGETALNTLKTKGLKIIDQEEKDKK